MRIVGLFLSLMFSHTCWAQFQLEMLDKNSIPQHIKYVGNIVRSVRWTDNLGDNVVILTATDKTPSKNALDDSYSDGALYAYHYLLMGDSSKLVWKVYDGVKECPVDMFLHFIDKTFAVTDLNKDGKAEVWMMYKVSCQGDVSPIPMKIIMYQDNQKYALRGTTRVSPSENVYMGGEYSFDDAFKTAPKEFQQYATELWKKHKKENWEQ